uniref:Uncharacterized protein n=1 Tax=Anguilla anguilla TaxID=7936 RepID=A0A0E9RSE5_ANGAN
MALLIKLGRNYIAVHVCTANIHISDLFSG